MLKAEERRPIALIALFYQVEENAEHILVVVFLVFKRPSRLEDRIIQLEIRGELTLSVEFESQVRGEDSSEEEIGLLVGELVRKRYGLGERDEDGALRREEVVEHYGDVLEEGHLDRISHRGEKEG